MATNLAVKEYISVIDDETLGRDHMKQAIFQARRYMNLPAFALKSGVNPRRLYAMFDNSANARKSLSNVNPRVIKGIALAADPHSPIDEDVLFASTGRVKRSYLNELRAEQLDNFFSKEWEKSVFKERKLKTSNILSCVQRERLCRLIERAAGENPVELFLEECGIDAEALSDFRSGIRMMALSYEQICSVLDHSGEKSVSIDELLEANNMDWYGKPKASPDAYMKVSYSRADFDIPERTAKAENEYLQALTNVKIFYEDRDIDSFKEDLRLTKRIMKDQTASTLLDKYRKMKTKKEISCKEQFKGECERSRKIDRMEMAIEILICGIKEGGIYNE